MGAARSGNDGFNLVFISRRLAGLPGESISVREPGVFHPIRCKYSRG